MKLPWLAAKSTLGAIQMGTRRRFANLASKKKLFGDRELALLLVSILGKVRDRSWTDGSNVLTLLQETKPF